MQGRPAGQGRGGGGGRRGEQGSDSRRWAAADGDNHHVWADPAAPRRLRLPLLPIAAPMAGGPRGPGAARATAMTGSAVGRWPERAAAGRRSAAAQWLQRGWRWCPGGGQGRGGPRPSQGRCDSPAPFRLRPASALNSSGVRNSRAEATWAQHTSASRVAAAAAFILRAGGGEARGRGAAVGGCCLTPAGGSCGGARAIGRAWQAAGGLGGALGGRAAATRGWQLARHGAPTHHPAPPPPLAGGCQGLQGLPQGCWGAAAARGGYLAGGGWLGR